MTEFEIVEVIRNENRSKEELKFVWEKLLKNPMVHIPKSVGVVNKILDKLKYISKSRLMTYNFCQTVFKYGYIYNLNVEQQQFYMKWGSRLHWVMEVLYNFIDLDKIVRMDNILKYIRTLILNKIVPKRFKFEGDIGKYVMNMIQNIAIFEQSKFRKIQNFGMNKENLERYFIPITTELGIENYHTYKVGFIDAEYNIPDKFGGKDKLCVVDYKFGQPKYYIDEGYEQEGIKTETTFYKMLREEPGAMQLDKETKTMKILPYKRVDFGMIVYFQDLATAKMHRFNELDIASLNENIEQFWGSLNKCWFLQKWRAMQYCMNQCPFHWDYCFKYEKKWSYLRNPET